MNISAAWAVDREFVHILGPSGTFRISCGMMLNSFCSLGCALGAPGVLRGASEARDEFSKFVWESELSTSAYSDNIWPTGKISKKKKWSKTYLFFFRKLIARASRLARERRDPHQLRI